MCLKNYEEGGKKEKFKNKLNYGKAKTTTREENKLKLREKFFLQREKKCDIEREKESTTKIKCGEKKCGL